MAERLHRTQVLLEPQQQRALAEIARREGRSVSDVVRTMIQMQLDQLHEQAEATLQRRIAALQRIRQHREEILAERGGVALDSDVVALIDEMREERDERNLHGSTGDRP
jgi:hypothetical protein